MVQHGDYIPHFQIIRFPLESGLFFEFTVLREDLAHGFYQGNKWWKLKHNLQYCKDNQIQCLLTFGGAYSNHIHAVAAAGKAYGLETIGIIRGEKPATRSPTLEFALQNGMQLEFISREEYRQKSTEPFLQKLGIKFPDAHIVPEGGSNLLGLQGCKEWGEQLRGKADIFCLAAGTATTAAGIALANPEAEVWAFSALKNGGFLQEEAEHLAGTSLPNLQIITDYAFGGYAKHTPELLDFIEHMERQFALPLEQVYTAKALYGVIDLAKQHRIPTGKALCFIHTGGLQGKLRETKNPA
ncbi:MAG: 1-aminocyclopropane-1-carboxylate deaminase/D-cysteine desulfhydrase [Flavobacteriales bacterium]|nr:1-aminocyclopropane-1-carboxylate deaminase/D-cysteine desulfhydrase [Flavobacteriales bacterium]